MQTKSKSFYGWVILGTVFFIYFCNMGIVLYGSSLLNALMIKNLGMAKSSAGMAMTTALIVQAVIGPIVGIMITKKGIKMPFALGSGLLVMGALLMALVPVTAPLFVLFYGVIIGAGQGFASLVAVQVAINDWFREKKPLAMGIAISAGAVGGFIAPPILKLLTGQYGWISGWYVVAGASAICMLLSLFVLVNKPADIGEVPDGIAALESKSVAASVQSAVIDDEPMLSLKDILKGSSIYYILLNLIIRTAVFYAFITYIVIYLLDKQISPATAAFVVSLFSIGSLIGRLGSGFIIGSLITNKTALVWGCIVQGIGIILLVAINGLAGVYTGALLAGMGIGLGLIAQPLVVAEYFGNRYFAMINGFISPLSFIVGGTCPAIIGLAATSAGGYGAPFVTLAILCIAAGLITLLLKAPKTVVS